MIDYRVATQEEDETGEKSSLICVGYVLQMKERKDMKSKKKPKHELGRQKLVE